LINVWHQPSNGTLSDPIVCDSAYGTPEPVTVADVNTEGWDDLVTLTLGKPGRGVLPAGSRALPESTYTITYASHYNVKAFDIGDINGDGLADVALADPNGYLVVLRQKAQ
jgi:hypothetical protein